MTIEQIVDVPATRRLIVDVPQEIPLGRTILAFTPAPPGEQPDAHDPEHIRFDAEYLRRKEQSAQSVELINRNAERLNQEMMDVLSYQGRSACPSPS
jgi:hypothetical protein